MGVFTQIFVNIYNFYPLHNFDIYIYYTCTHENSWQRNADLSINIRYTFYFIFKYYYRLLTQCLITKNYTKITSYASLEPVYNMLLACIFGAVVFEKIGFYENSEKPIFYQYFLCDGREFFLLGIQQHLGIGLEKIM